MLNIRSEGSDISIHSLRMEGDVDLSETTDMTSAFQSTPSAWRETPSYRLATFAHNSFQSTPSAWRETAVVVAALWVSPISIHSLRMEGDSVVLRWIRAVDYFNPLPPHGGRRQE